MAKLTSRECRTDVRVEWAQACSNGCRTKGPPFGSHFPWFVYKLTEYDFSIHVNRKFIVPSFGRPFCGSQVSQMQKVDPSPSSAHKAHTLTHAFCSPIKLKSLPWCWQRCSVTVMLSKTQHAWLNKFQYRFAAMARGDTLVHSVLLQIFVHRNDFSLLSTK